MEGRGSQEQSKRARTEGLPSEYSRSSNRQRFANYRPGRQRIAQSETGSSVHVPSSGSQNNSGFKSLGHNQQQHSGFYNGNRLPCQTCGNIHSRLCHKLSGACFECGQLGHHMRECPQIVWVSS